MIEKNQSVQIDKQLFIKLTEQLHNILEHMAEIDCNEASYRSLKDKLKAAEKTAKEITLEITEIIDIEKTNPPEQKV